MGLYYVLSTQHHLCFFIFYLYGLEEHAYVLIYTFFDMNELNGISKITVELILILICLYVIVCFFVKYEFSKIIYITLEITFYILTLMSYDLSFLL